MRALGLVAVIVPTLAIAESPTQQSGYFFRLEPGVAMATFRQKTTYALFGEPISMREKITGEGVAAQVELAFGHGVTPRLELGGMLRVGKFQMNALHSDDQHMPGTFDSGATYIHVGPQLTFAPMKQLYVRTDVGIGILTRNDDEVIPAYDLSTLPFQVLAIGIEAGYATRLRRVPIKAGVAIDGAWAKTGEDGDQGRYDSRTRVISVAFVASVVLGGR